MLYHHLTKLQILEESAKQTKHLVNLKKIFVDSFKEIRIVNKPPNNKKLNKIGIISGFGLKKIQSMSH